MVRVKLKPVLDAPVLAESDACVHLALSADALWRTMYNDLASHVVSKGALPAGTKIYFYIGSAGLGYTPFIPFDEQRVVDIVDGFAGLLPPGTHSSQHELQLVISYSLRPAWM